MPVTIKPSPDKVGHNADKSYTTEKSVYAALIQAWDNDSFGFSKETALAKRPLPILHSSFSNLTTRSQDPIVPYRNGFVDGVIRAFQQDLHLTIRPDDVWLSIITQFSFYVNKNAESLRKMFVNHEGKEDLVISDLDKPFSECNIADMAQKLTKVMQDKIKDPAVRDWLLPVFSTTTDHDKAVNSMVMMATMKEYFNYAMVCGCGFPSVTLLGEISDWQMILERLDKFAQYGGEVVPWSKMLYPIIKRFIATFYMPESEELKKFWMHAVHSIGRMGSGMELAPYNGWLTAFMFWDSHGKRALSSLKTDANGLPPLELDGVVYPFGGWRRDGVPTGVIEVPVKVEARDLGVELDTLLVAGSMGVTVQDEYRDGGSMVQPHSAWFMLEKGRKAL